MNYVCKILVFPEQLLSLWVNRLIHWTQPPPVQTSFQHRPVDSLAWSSFVFLYDSSISAEARKRIMAEMERDEGSTFSFHDLGDTAQVDRAKLNMLLGKTPFRDMGGKFILAVSKDIVSMVLDEV